jgi:glycine oxidase
MTITQDIIIVGGGIIGCLTALELKNQGLNVTIIDQKRIGSECSWAGAGILFPLLPWNYPIEIYNHCKGANQYYKTLSEILIKETGVDPEFHSPGLLICSPKVQQDGTNWLNKNKVDYQWKKYKQYDCLLIKDVAQIRNPRLMNGLRSLLHQRKVNILEDTKILPINTALNKLEYINTYCGKRLSADSFIVTAGAWSPGINKEYLNQIVPIRGQIIQYKASDIDLDRIIYLDRSYILKRKDGVILVGSSSEDVGFCTRMNNHYKDIFKKKAEKILPELKHIPIEKHWCGFRPRAEGNTPLLRVSSTFKNLFINSGHFRYGLTMAPYSALKLQELLIT